MLSKLFGRNTESVGDANSQKDYLEYCIGSKREVASATSRFCISNMNDGLNSNHTIPLSLRGCTRFTSCPWAGKRLLLHGATDSLPQTPEGSGSGDDR